MGRLKIFCAYHKPWPVFASDCVEPIQVGASTSTHRLGILRDDTGRNISSRNGGYCELTAQYWVWQNFLPAHPEVEWVGFCHYRRFMDFWKRTGHGEASYFNFRYVPVPSFEKSFLSDYREENILRSIPTDAGIVLPEASLDSNVLHSLLALYKVSWGGFGVWESLGVAKDSFPEYLCDFNWALDSRRAYHCLTFLMKRDVFKRYAEWMFSFIDMVSGKIAKASWYRPDGRWEGYLAELFFNVWLLHEMRCHGTKTHECGGVMLVSPETGAGEDKARGLVSCLKWQGSWLKAWLWSKAILAGAGLRAQKKEST